MRHLWTAAAVAAALALFACGGTDSGDSGRGALALEGDPERGAVLFANICAPCHGADGSGGSQGVDLRDHLGHHTDEELVGILANGSGRMADPGLQDDQEIADLLAYLRATFP